ncbi:hypothetical protein ACFFMN_23510 [Planobispora siamensis]|uniref:hypothetical protein n=1 Tax=Planobispora siamensis TaxID=936338 RepID=UPI00194E633E|nr:hypothetical protein [Planobispora siamensis]
MTDSGQPVLARTAAGSYTVTRDGILVGTVRKLARSWAWYVAGDPSDGCPDLRPTRAQAVVRLLLCVDTRAELAAYARQRADAEAARTAALLADGYALADVADLEEGQMVRTRAPHCWREPALAVQVETFDNGGALLVSTPLHGPATPAQPLLLSAATRTVLYRTRTPHAERAWARWLAETDDSPNACAARAIPTGWIPGPWEQVTAGAVIRVPTRIRCGRVYEWSHPYAVTSHSSHPRGGIVLSYRYFGYDDAERADHDLIAASVAAYGVLRPR